MFLVETRQIKQICRLCHYETTDTVDIYSDKGREFDYEGKINKYLYLYVGQDDNLPKTICWMCTQHLETFHKFYDKINEIQQTTLKDSYVNFVLKPVYEKTTYEIIDEVDIEEAKVAQPVESVVKEADSEDNNLVEVLYVSDDFGYEPENEIHNRNEDEENTENLEEYEVYEVEQVPAQIVKEEILSPQKVNTTAPQSPVAFQKSVVDSTSAASKPHPATGTDQQLQDIQSKQQNSRMLTMQTDTIATAGRITRQTAAKESVSKISLQKRSPEKNQSDNLTKRRAVKTLPKILNKQHLSKAKVSAQDRTASKRRKHDGNMRIKEGDSENEFPGRDSDNEEWPNQQTLDEFPKEILRDGLLVIKGQQLMSLICKFYNLVCDLCTDKRRYRSLKSLFSHYFDTHNESGYLICCQTKLSRYPAIIMHMARHLQPNAFRCDECGYMVTRPRFLESHKLTHLPEDEKPFYCEHCPRRFCWKGALQIHMISHQPADKRRHYMCHVCGKSYDTPGGLSTHKKLIHCDKKQQQSNVCDVCAKSFATRTGLHEHMTTIHQPREKDQVQCSECGKWLMNNRCLKSHMILHSNVEYNCDLCDYSTKKKVLLNRHHLTQHSEEKPFNCNLCDKSFKLKRALTVHLAQHNSVKKYECPFCKRVFNSSTNFYSHRKNVHPKELADMRNKELEYQRLKRIAAGIEDARDGEYVLTENSGGTLELSDENLILTSPTGQEITIIQVDDDKYNGNISIPINVVNEKRKILPNKK